MCNMLVFDNNREQINIYLKILCVKRKFAVDVNGFESLSALENPWAWF